DQTLFDLLYANQRGRAGIRCHAQMLQDFLEIQVAVLRVDAHPVVAQRDGNLRDRRRFKRHPQAMRRLPSSEFLLELVFQGGRGPKKVRTGVEVVFPETLSYLASRLRAVRYRP